MVQNKLHYAAHGHTAAEVIYERADASQPFMGLKSFSGDFPVLKDISIAKNYLNDEELKILNNIVSGYFDFAEIQAMRHNPMYMADYVEHLDNVLKCSEEKWEILLKKCFMQIPDFNHLEFEGVRKEAGLNAFTMSPSRWIEATNAKGLVAMAGRYGGTYARTDIAFEFASWISVEFKLYLVKEFQRLKEEEQKLIGWSVKRELSKLNYRIHTDAIKQNIVPEEIDAYHKSLIYAEEADVLNVAMFGMTAKEWRDANPDKKGNIRDYATINELICLSNMENLNAVFINDGMPQTERLVKLNQVAIQQMKVLEESENRKYLK